MSRNSYKKYLVFVMVILTVICSLQPLAQKSFSSSDNTQNSDNNQSSTELENPNSPSVLRKETSSGKYFVELTWSQLGPAEEMPEDANNQFTTISFTVTIFDSNDFPGDNVLYDFIVRNVSSSSTDDEVIQRFTNQNPDDLGSARHNVTFEADAENTIQVDVVIKSIGSLPVLLNDRATFEIVVVPEFPHLVLTMIVSFSVGAIIIITRAKLLLHKRE